VRTRTFGFGPGKFPIVAPFSEAAVALVRRSQEQRSIDTRRWRHYESEPLLNPLHKLVVDVRRGRVSTLTIELERQRAATLRAAPV